MTGKTQDYKNNTRRSFDKKSSNYDQTYDGKYCAKMYEEVMNKLRMQAFERVLDIGCGTGTVLSMILKEYGNVQVSGIDISNEMLKKAAAVLGDSAELVNADSADMPWKDDSFDVVLCSASFHHFPEPKKDLKEIWRVLKPDGRVVIADPWWPNPRRFFINLFLKTPFNTGGDVRVYSENELSTLLLESGFGSIQWETPGNKFGMVCAAAIK